MKDLCRPEAEASAELVTAAVSTVSSEQVGLSKSLRDDGVKAGVFRIAGSRLEGRLALQLHELALDESLYSLSAQGRKCEVPFAPELRRKIRKVLQGQLGAWGILSFHVLAGALRAFFRVLAVFGSILQSLLDILSQARTADAAWCGFWRSSWP